MCRKADDMFTDVEVWKNVHDRDRRELFDDVVHLIAKREKVSCYLAKLHFNATVPPALVTPLYSKSSCS
jgi:predicted DNA-binding protein (UPF0278 family)